MMVSSSALIFPVIIMSGLCSMRADPDAGRCVWALPVNIAGGVESWRERKGSKRRSLPGDLLEGSCSRHLAINRRASGSLTL